MLMGNFAGETNNVRATEFLAVGNKLWVYKVWFLLSGRRVSKARRLIVTAKKKKYLIYGLWL